MRQTGGLAVAAGPGQAVGVTVAPQPQGDVGGVGAAPGTGLDRCRGEEQRMPAAVEGRLVDEVLPPGEAEHGVGEVPGVVEEHEAAAGLPGGRAAVAGGHVAAVVVDNCDAE